MTKTEHYIIVTALEERHERLADGPPATLCHPDEETVLPALIDRMKEADSLRVFDSFGRRV